MTYTDICKQMQKNANNPTPEEIAEYDRLTAADDGSKRRRMSSVIGHFLPNAVSIALASGAARVASKRLGLLKGPGSAVATGFVGATAGMTPMILAAILAKARGARTQEEQDKYRNSGALQGLMDYTIPGVATYNMSRTMQTARSNLKGKEEADT